jgi:alanyl-tRNA synthetase
MPSSNDIRATFLDYFARNGHAGGRRARRWCRATTRR